MADNFEPLQGAGKDEKEVDALTQSIKMGIVRFANEIGAIQKVEFLGTLPGPDGRENALQTIVKLKGKKENLFMSLIWLNGKIIGLEPMFMFSLKIAEISSYTLSNNEFAGYNLGIAKNVRLSFSEDSRGSITGPFIHGKKNVEASRTNN